MGLLSSLDPPGVPELTYSGKVISDVLHVIIGDSVSLSCTSDGNPNPTIGWNGGSSTTLEFTSIQKSNSNQYTCNVANTMVPSTGASKTRTATKTVNIDVMCKYAAFYLISL